MIYYIAEIVSNPGLFKKRKPAYSHAGTKRALFLADSIREQVTILSEAKPQASGIFSSLWDQYNNTSIRYFPAIAFFFLKKNPLRIFFSWFLFIWLMKRIKPNDTVLIYNCTIYKALAIKWLSKFRKFRLICQIEEIYGWDKGSAKKVKAEQVLFSRCNDFIISNPSIREYINKADARYLVSRGYDFDFANADIDSSVKVSGNPVIAYTGRFDYRGGVELLLEASRHISSPATISITGKGPLEHTIKTFNPGNPLVTLTFLGTLDDEAYIRFMKQIDLAVNPLRVNDAYGKLSFSSKILTYLGFGVPVITSPTNIDDMEMLKPHISFYPDDSPEELAKAIDKTIKALPDKKIIREATLTYFRNQKQKINDFIANE